MQMSGLFQGLDPAGEIADAGLDHGHIVLQLVHAGGGRHFFHEELELLFDQVEAASMRMAVLRWTWAAVSSIFLSMASKRLSMASNF